MYHFNSGKSNEPAADRVRELSLRREILRLSNRIRRVRGRLT
jgi:hypothetical protein